MSLPSGYRRLEYIQSSGTRYINTGFRPNQDTRLVIVAAPMSIDDAAQGVGFIPYGAGASYNSNAFECYTTSHKLEFNYDGQYDFIGTATIGTVVTIDHNKNNVSIKQDSQVVASKIFNYNLFSAPYDLTLFGINRGSVSCGLLRLYSCQIYNNGTLVRDFVPCINSSNVAGLYDLIGNKFYPSASSTALIAGPYTTVKTGDILNYDYTGAVQTVTLPKGTYKLECWGAQGGYRSGSSYGGHGGYSVGTITLKKATTLYVYVGGSGNTGGTSGGFNGGGKRNTYNGGGGASDIRIDQDSLYARVIVAGGGGSCGASSKTGGYGGGETGGAATSGYGTGGGAGTQTAGGSGGSGNSGTFGVGGEGLYRKSGYGGAGGGGWYGGGGCYPDSSGDDDKGGGGGSGYVYTASTASNYPSGCLLNSTYYLESASTIAGNVSMPSISGSTETGHSGNGYVRITVIKAQSLNIPVNIGNSWKNGDAISVNIGGTWKQGESAFVNINGTWKELS